jgi:hypothetical protein
MNTEQRSASTVTEPERQAEIAQRLTDLARQLRGLLTDFPSDAVWNRPARLVQLADDCKAEAEDFDESLEPRAETLAAWDDVMRILKQGRRKSPA